MGESQDHKKVMGYSLELPVSSIFHMPLKGFSLNFGQMFISVRRCAEPMTQVCRFEVKVIKKVMGLSFKIMCLLHMFLDQTGD